MLHFDIDQFAARRADSVIVTVRHSVKPAGSIAELNLGNVSGIFQISQTVVNGRETDRRQHFLRRRKNLVRGQVRIRLADRPQNHLTLPRQT